MRTYMKKAPSKAKKIIACLMVFALLVPFVSSMPLLTASAESLSRTYLLNNDTELNGVSSRYDWYFNIDPNWTLSNTTFELHYSISDLLLKDLSSMTVYLNDHPIESFGFNDAVMNREYVKSMVLPLKELTPGINTISVRGHARLSGSFCTDNNSVSNWIRLHKNTNVKLKFQDNKSNRYLKDYPAPYGGLMNDQGVSTSVVCEQIKKPVQAGAALTFMSFLGGLTEQPERNLRLESLETFDWNAEHPSVYIGSAKGLPESIRQEVSKNSALPKGSEVLLTKLSASNQNNERLLILSEDDSQLLRGVKALHSPKLVKQMTSASLMLKPETNVENPVTPEDDYLLLSELGLNGLNFKGPYRQAASFGFRNDGKQLSELGSKIVLNFRYSENLDFDTSLLTVFINNIPVGSKRLLLENSKSDRLEVTIPKELRSASYYDVKIAFDLEMRIGICDIKPTEMPWAYVTPDSFLYLPSTKKSISLFSDLPAPFAENQTLQNIDLVIPNNLTSQDYEALGSFFALTGNRLTQNYNAVRVLSSETWTVPGMNQDAQVVIYENPTPGSAITKIKDLLWFKPDDTLSLVASNEKLELLPDFSQQSGFIELKTVSQWNGKSLLAIYSLDPTQLSKTLKHLTDEKKRGLLSGDAAVIGPDQKSMSFQFQKEAPPKEKLTAKTITPETIQLAVFLLLIIGLFAIGLGIVLYRNRHADKKHYKGSPAVPSKANTTPESRKTSDH